MNPAAGDLDSNGLYWLTFGSAPEIDGTKHSILRLKVKFNNFAGLKAGFVHPNLAGYDYSFGYKFNEMFAFWDNVYSTGYGAAIGPDGGAGNPMRFNIYTVDGEGNANEKVLDAMNNSNWAYYKHNGEKLIAGTEYIFEFDTSGMSDFMFSAFAAKDGNGPSMEISEVTWASSLLIA